MLELLNAESGLSKKSIRMLHNRFLELAKRNKDAAKGGESFLTKADFDAIPDLLKNPLGSRLIEVFFVDAEWVGGK